MGLEDRAFLATHWPFWARPDQIEPKSKDWATWMILAGRGWGKTRVGAETIRSWVCGKTPMSRGRYRRIALVAETAADARDVLVEGESGILGIHSKDFRPTYLPSKRRLTWPNGAIATLYNATEPDQLRGPQHDAAWCFIAGTKVLVPGGERNIEDLAPGDMVITRDGPRRIVATSVRAQPVGTVTTESGVLTGTYDHPILTPDGWVSLGEVSGCVIGVSSSKEGGITVAKEGTTPSEEPKASVEETEADCIGTSGKTLTGQSSRGTKSIIGTSTPSTTSSQTFSSCRKGSTEGSTCDSSRLIEAEYPPSRVNAESVGLSYFESSDTLKGQSAALAEIGESRKLEPKKEAAFSAEIPSELGKHLTAVSVVSTWQPEGVQNVYCLKVEGTPEYVANGIVVHNCDELAKWAYAREAWDQLQFGLRLGVSPRCIVTTTPRPIPVLKEILNDESTFLTKGNTLDNEDNLAKRFIEKIYKRYAGTRLGRQELNAEVLDDLPGALWLRTYFDPPEGSAHTGRILAKDLPDLDRIVVAVDPSGTKGKEDNGDEIGIVVAGIDVYDHGYILADRTVKEGPSGWAKAAVSAYHEFKADCIVGEVNYGGAMVEHTIRSADANAPFKMVRATRGKVVRAEPVSALYEQGRVHHVVGADIKDKDEIGLSGIEDQLCLFSPRGYAGEGSPDRADAAIWALTELMLEPEEGYSIHDLKRANQ